MDQFKVEDQFKQYLMLVKLEEETMSDIQLQETRRAFYGAWGQAFILMRDGIGAIEDEDIAITAMQSQIDQVSDYWRKEVEDV